MSDVYLAVYVPWRQSHAWLGTKYLIYGDFTMPHRRELSAKLCWEDGWMEVFSWELLAVRERQTSLMSKMNRSPHSARQGLMCMSAALLGPQPLFTWFQHIHHQCYGLFQNVFHENLLYNVLQNNKSNTCMCVSRRTRFKYEITRRSSEMRHQWYHWLVIVHKWICYISVGGLIDSPDLFRIRLPKVWDFHCL